MLLTRQQSRWLVSVMLALFVYAGALGLAGLLFGAAPAPIASGSPAAQAGGLRVSLRTAASMVPAAAFERRATAARPMEPPRAAAAAGRVPEPRAAAGAPAGASGGSILADAASGAAAAEPAAVLPESAADAGDAAGSATVAGHAGGTGDGATEAELLRRLDALIRGNLAYPPLARRRNIQGEVRLSLLIGADGTLGRRAVVSGSGSSILDSAALALIDRLFPLDLGYTLDGPASIVVRIVYSLTS